MEMNDTKPNRDSFFLKAFLLVLFMFTLNLISENKSFNEKKPGNNIEVFSKQLTQTKAILVSPGRVPPFNINWAFGCESEFLAKLHPLHEVYSPQNHSEKYKLYKHLFLSFKSKLDNQTFITLLYRSSEIPASYSA